MVHQGKRNQNSKDSLDVCSLWIYVHSSTAFEFFEIQSFSPLTHISREKVSS